jgi:hypothetical protein
LAHFLLLFSFLVWISAGTLKNPPAWVAGGLQVSSISLAVLDQAIAVRRHGGSMMVVMAEMAAALHL